MFGRSLFAGARTAISVSAVVGVVGAWAAAPGELDTSFSGDGMTTLALSRSFDAPSAVVGSRDGTILVAVQADPRRDFRVMRLRDDGSLDPEFGTGGIARVDLKGGADNVADVIEQPDGKIVLAGDTTWSRHRREGFAFVRLLADGQRDPSFGRNGVRVVAERRFGRFAECPGVDALTLSANGRIMVVGGVGCGGEGGRDLRLAALRLHPDGGLDRSFHGDGLWSSRAGCDAAAVSVGADGGILIAASTGSTDYCTFGKMRLIRLGSDGRSMADWATGGRSTIGFPGFRNAYTAAMAVDVEGRALLVGYAERRVAFARVLADGRLDPSFGNGGRRVLPRFAHRSEDYATAVALARDGSALVPVSSYQPKGRTSSFNVVRVTPDGRPDDGFGTGGRQSIPFGVRYATTGDLMIDALDRAVAVGAVYSRRTETDFAAARLR
jgi:uncharacterized delta-60 repeat protein